MKERTSHQQMIDRCLKIDRHLKTLKKAFVFDEQDEDSFENTYNHKLQELIATNWENYNAAYESKRIEDFHKQKLD